MFIGHNAFAFATKRIAPRGSLGVYTAAVMLPDLIWPIFLLLGIEHVRIEPGATRFTPLDFYDYPWTHSLVMTGAWGLFFGGITMAMTRYLRGAVWVTLGVVSHWVLDFVVHRPDLPLYPHGPVFGLGLWNYPLATILIESAMFVVAILIYRRATRPIDRIGSIGMWSFIVTLALIYLANASGNPPPSARAVAYLGLALWFLPFWAGWFDRHREPIA
jgi:membrane-bound metal-dependent hydrolase YbcI (DUF457 family)